MMGKGEIDKGEIEETSFPVVQLLLDFLQVFKFLGLN